MSDSISACTTPEEGWDRVSHFTGNILLVIRNEVNNKRDGWKTVVVDKKEKLLSHLDRIAKDMLDHGYVQDSENITKVCQAVRDCDFSDPNDVDTVNAKISVYSKTSGKMDAKLEELFGNKK